MKLTAIILLSSLTFLVLLLGLLIMASGGKANKKYGSKIMVLRVICQGMAIALVTILLLING